MAGLVTVAVFAVVTWVFADGVTPLWVHDAADRLGWGFGAGTAASALAALWGKGYATAGEGRSGSAAQVVQNSRIGGGLTQVSGAGRVKISHRTAGTGLPPEEPQAPDTAAEGASGRTPFEGGGQRVSGATVAGPVDQVSGAEGDVEIEQ
ncbi:hypothetical protein GXW83_12955 [Streptacidiphilus sp. PB12-B1b]|uniref:hypothetical protein n=1 Tax=Streptacidiphilus sp. PB12-B1b TaxID=2705012 RepID=UPI0015F80CEE|nr:hypothetical protein [Streptacidiphilus sp. PB12-B1b]QMU76517.1 hypothetical protein GXW83_12955 [Streptacidiphilus sp. PB12-B1b]